MRRSATGPRPTVPPHGTVGGRMGRARGDRLLVMEPFDASIVRAVYDTVAEDYAEAFAGDLLNLPLDRQILHTFARRIAPGGLVLDLGCGPGQVGQYLVELGLRVVGMDPAQRMLLVARRRTGNGRVLCGDMRAHPLTFGIVHGRRGVLLRPQPSTTDTRDRVGRDPPCPRAVGDARRRHPPGGWGGVQQRVPGS